MSDMERFEVIFSVEFDWINVYILFGNIIILDRDTPYVLSCELCKVWQVL